MRNYDIFLEIDGVKGESTDKQFKDAIEIKNFEFEVNQPTKQHSGKGNASGKPIAKNITCEKDIDRSSNTITQSCFSGKVFKKATFSFRKAGGENPMVYFKVELTNISIVSINQNTKTSDTEITETIAINYDTIKKTYTPQKADLSEDAQITYGYSIKENSELV